MESVAEMQREGTPIAHLPSDGRSVIGNFISVTAMNGLKHIDQGKAITYKIAWTIIFLVSFGVFIYHGEILISGFLNYGTVTSMARVPNMTLQFPQITFCNINPAKRSAIIAKSAALPTMFKLLANASFFLEQSGQNNSATSADVRRIEWLIAQSDTSDKSDVSANIFFSRKHLDMVGYSSSDLLFRCNWNSQEDCTSDPLKLIQHSRYGNCYTWNGNGTVRYSRTFGINSGVKMVFKVFAKEYGGFLSSYAGMRVIITPQGYAPVVSAVTLSTGTASLETIKLQAHETTRLPSPYRSACISEYPKELHPYLSDPEKRYSRRACFLGCSRYRMAVECNCTKNIGLDFKKLKEIHGPKFRYCIPFYEGGRDFECLFNVTYDMHRSGISECKAICKAPCQESSYEIQHTAIPWPSDSYTRSMVGSGFWTAGELKTNYVKLHVFLEADFISRMEERPARTFPNLISAIGGIGGLYVGISLIVIIECLELAMELIFLLPFVKIWSKVKALWIRNHLPQIGTGRVHALWSGSRKTLRKLTSQIMPPRVSIPNETSINLADLECHSRASYDSLPPFRKIDL